MRGVLGDAEIAAQLTGALAAWRVEDGALIRTCHTNGFRAALMVANAIGHLAEAAWHHPDLTVSFGVVGIRLSTHDAGGITEKDLALARQIEALVFRRPESPFTGPPRNNAYVKDSPE